ncbi:MAG: ornithine decarboxylase [Acidobacteria bacterium]|nr:ornithine decarboxylase [Acidobacteriota bacterium]
MRKVVSNREFRAYYDASQFRTDTWNELKLATARLARTPSNGEKSEASQAILDTLDVLEEVERYWAFPGKRACRNLRNLAARDWRPSLAAHTARLARLLESDDYRRRAVHDIFRDLDDAAVEGDSGESLDASSRETRPYFEILVVDRISPEEEDAVRSSMLSMRRERDEFIYDIVFVPSCEDAIIAALFNDNVQACVLRYSFPRATTTSLPELRDYLHLVDPDLLAALEDPDPSVALAKALKNVRPELDLYMVTDDPIENVAGRTDGIFRRVFYRQEDYLELHLSILKGIDERYDTPFFSALREYSQKPTGVFHALPISRGKSISKSHWIGDMGEFYGPNIFLAETSSTTGGLDSLLQPTGPLKRAQEKMARAYGSRRSYFVTNGTSTANKIVMQALCRPDDIVLVSHDCHKSHHYALMLAGSNPVYLDAYPLQRYSIYGGVPLKEIKKTLFRLKKAGKLDRVRMLLLTNCTFDGVVYNPEMVMREVLAIKPDMVFVWDEAWYAFARFTPTYRQRTGMESTHRLREMFKSEAYREKYARWKAEHAELDPDDEATWTENALLPDPDKARLRVYVTQSTHKTLTSLRQGSVIHIQDQDFTRKAHDAFEEAYMTHTSTSPNYQILASLDVGRRQVELEGYELVTKSVELAMTLRQRIEENPAIRKYFKLLRVEDLIPTEFRASGLTRYYDPEKGYQRMQDAWRNDEFTLEPQRVTVHIGSTGIDGDTMRKRLMDSFDIQINKTSRNTVLFMLNIGTTRGAIAYLLEVFMKLSREFDELAEERSPLEEAQFADSVESFTERLPPLPNFSHFHPKFQPQPESGTPEGDLRTAFFLAYEESNCEYLPIGGALDEQMASGRDVVSAMFVTPYPPGFPILVPGQVVSDEILSYLKALDVKEIHGYNPKFGLRVFTTEALDNLNRLSARF